MRRQILKELPYGQDWLVTPHQLLGGDTPAERIRAGDVEGVKVRQPHLLALEVVGLIVLAGYIRFIVRLIAHIR